MTTAAKESDRSLSSFNARTYSAQRVAESFVPPEAFFELVNPVHSVLSGPRGSGKTTLLKMLQPEALERWVHPRAASTLNSVGYTGVFVATDRIWKQQLEPDAAADGWQSVVATSAFATHVARELVTTMAWRAHTESENQPHHARASLSSADELLLVREMSKLLKLSVEVPRLESVVSALISRFRDHGEFLKQAHPAEVEVPEWVIRDTLGTAEACVRLFNNACRQNEHQWALLFDEMELAPAAVTESVLDAMRGSQSILLFKLSLSPAQPELARLNLPDAGVHGQDFELIRLSAQYSAAPRFVEDIVNAELIARYGASSKVDLESVFGPGRFARLSDDDTISPKSASESDPYRVNSPLWKKFESLAKTDPSFQTWLDRRNVDLHDLGSLTASQRAAKIRKVRNIVLIREYYRRPNQTGRKSHDLYTGAEGVATLVDANPRLLMAFLGRVLPPALPTKLPINRAIQSAAIDSIMERFITLLSSQPAVPMPDDGHLRALDLVEAIGEEFGRRLVHGAFSDNIVTAFQVDRRTPPHVVRALQIALNVGAIVHIPKDPGKAVPANLEGEIFRLSYVLAPRYRLPLRLGEHRELRSILTRTEGRRWYFTAPPRRLKLQSRQASLFDLLDATEGEKN
jgi:hypothetical protein